MGYNNIISTNFYLLEFFKWKKNKQNLLKKLNFQRCVKNDERFHEQMVKREHSY